MKSKMVTLRKILLNSAYHVGKLLKINKPQLVVLCYHSISTNRYRYAVSLKSFEKQMKKLSQSFSFVSLDQITDENARKKIKLPAIAITVDDGYKDALTILPITKKYHIPVTAFVLSNPRNSNRNELDNNLSLLSIKQIRLLIKNGWTIGCHTDTHANLLQSKEKDLNIEITKSKMTLEKKLSIKIKYFAYPRGYYNKNIIAIVKSAGFKAAFTIGSSTIQNNNNPFELPRTIVDKTHSLSEFPALFSKSTFLLRTITNKFQLWEKFLSI